MEEQEKFISKTILTTKTERKNKMKNLICKGMTYVQPIASILLVIALVFEIAEHVKGWRKTIKLAKDTPSDESGGGDEKQ